jgi:predicted ATPase
VVFERPLAAAIAAADGQRALAAEPWDGDAKIRVRMGLHTGDGVLSGRTYVGNDVNRAARISAAGHGGQILLSETMSALVADSPPPGTTIRGLGEHRLKDLRPERLCQLVVDGLPQEFPPIRSLDARPNNLPTQLTTFVGRERELADAAARFERARLLTLTGPGGTGKTRLCLELASRVADRFPDGVDFVPLEPINDAALVPATIAQSLGLPDRGGREPVVRLIEQLAGKRVLLVLDNLEQVTDVAGVVGVLLAGAPELRVLATSRSPLHVYGEIEYPVPPLAVPDPKAAEDLDQLAAFESVALFVERAMAVRPSFRLTNKEAAAVAMICVRLDGLPLAIELAAARVKLLSPEAILARLENRLALLSDGARDLPARQRTLRGAIAWSYDLLDEPDRLLFADLSVFIGGASLDAIEAVCGPDQSRDVLDGLSSLVDKSLVRQGETPDGEPRFAMLETIREYAREQLVAGGHATDVERRHGAWYTSLAETAAGYVMSADKRMYLDRLEMEHDNLRAALTWAIEGGDDVMAVRLATALWRFWQMRGYLGEGLARLERALALPDAAAQTDTRLAALDAAGGLAYWSADYEKARRYYFEVLEIWRARGDKRGIAESLYNLSFAFAFSDGADQGRELINEALRLYEEIGDDIGAARARWALSNIEYAAGDLKAARPLAMTALETFDRINDTFMIGWATFTLGLADLIERDLPAAGRQLRRSLQTFADSGDVSGYTLVLDAMSALAVESGDRPAGARIAGGVATLERTTGTRLNLANRALYGYDPTSLKTDADTAAAYVEGEKMSVDEVVAFALGYVVPD